MKKSILKYMLLGVLAAPVLSSCDMDQFSSDNLTPEEAQTSLDDAEAWRMGMYSTARGTFGSVNTFLSDLCLPGFAATDGYSNYYALTATWQFQNSDTDEQSSVWASYYSLIARANGVIESVEAIRTNLEKEGEVSEATHAELDQIKGEAHLFRAWCYNQLAEFFCDRYDKDNAATQKGLPLVKVIDENAKPARSNLEDTYTFIFEDLTEARRLMSDTQMENAGRYLHNGEIVTTRGLLSEAALDLVEARAALNTGNLDLAIQDSENIINKSDAKNSEYAVLDNEADLTKMWTYDSGSEIIFQCYQNKDERGAEWSSLGGISVRLTSAMRNMGWIGSDDYCYTALYAPSTDLINSYGFMDIRQYVYLVEHTTYSNSKGRLRGYFLNKYPGNPDLKKSVDDCYNTAKPLRSPEAYLIAAEAYQKKGLADDARIVFNKFVNKRSGTTMSASVAGDEAKFNQFLAEEYQREFVGEGRAWSAYKRLNVNVKRSADQQQMQSVARMNFLEIAPDNIRWTWEIPQNDLFANKKLVPNWSSK